MNIINLTSRQLRVEQWKEHAACRDDPDPDAWFPDTGDEDRKEHALNICRTRCFVRLDCLMSGLAYGERGIWGGMTEKQRSTALNEVRRRKSAGNVA
jgi:hypothetical protein